MIMDTNWTHEDNKKSRNLVYQVFREVKSDLDWIQTSNLLSRNQVRYSVAPRGLFCGCKYSYKKKKLQIIYKKYKNNFLKEIITIIIDLKLF